VWRGTLAGLVGATGRAAAVAGRRAGRVAALVLNGRLTARGFGVALPESVFFFAIYLFLRYARTGEQETWSFPSAGVDDPLRAALRR
jgi:hypothetical protein